MTVFGAPLIIFAPALIALAALACIWLTGRPGPRPQQVPAAVIVPFPPAGPPGVTDREWDLFLAAHDLESLRSTQ